ncbi:hypothetical protein GQX74_009793 [Glossina fuscipes]|nr:hypothetical protein GQX74_009793 [Glossina fuscipes]
MNIQTLAAHALNFSLLIISDLPIQQLRAPLGLPLINPMILRAKKYTQAHSFIYLGLIDIAAFELRVPACHLSIFQAWETFLQEVETDSQASNDVASVLSRQS